MYVCTFAEFVGHGVFNISAIKFNTFNHRERYGALLWNYARRNHDDGAISESELTSNATSRLDSSKNLKDVISDV